MDALCARGREEQSKPPHEDSTEAPGGPPSSLHLSSAAAGSALHLDASVDSSVASGRAQTTHAVF